MTSTQSMFEGRRCWWAMARVLAVGLGLLATAWLGGCSFMNRPPPLTPPSVLEAPYEGTGGDVLWAVAPLRNESGTTLVDPLVISDKVVAAVSETRGVRCLPLNRSIEAMRALNMSAVRSPADAMALSKALGADGILVGSVTAYEPYQPVMGLSLALYGREGAMHQAQQQQLDARSLTSKASEPAPTGGSNFGQRPLSVVSEHLDGKNHQVLLDVQSYATGRSDPTSSLGWKRYVASMDLYTEFAAHHALGRLLREEWVRVGRTPPGEVQK